MSDGSSWPHGGRVQTVDSYRGESVSVSDGDVRQTLGKTLSLVESLAGEVARLAGQVSDNDKALRGGDGEDGLVTRIRILEGSVETTRWFARLLIAGFVGQVVIAIVYLVLTMARVPLQTPPAHGQEVEQSG